MGKTKEKQKVKDKILQLLKMKGAQTATTLAEQLAISPMAVRQHLQLLKAEQWVIYREERRGMGRPVKLWQLTEHSVSRFPDSHADLMLDLLRGMETVFGSVGMEKLLAERSRRQIQTYQAKLGEMEISDTWKQKVKAIAQLRDQEGYMAEVLEQPDNSLVLIENHCPICAAAQTCPGLCGGELEVFRAILGEMAIVERIEHVMAGDRRCAYRISEQERGQLR